MRSLSLKIVLLVGAVVALVVVAVAAVVVLAFRSDERVNFVKPDPTRVVFDRDGSRTGVVTVRNTSTTASVALQEARVEGPDRAAYSVGEGSCRATLGPGRSCQLTVRFSPPQSGTFMATVVVPTNKGRAPGVEVTGTA